MSKHNGASRTSAIWDVLVPAAAAGVPAGLFALLGIVSKGLDGPNAEPSALVAATMTALQTLGMIAMAFVILMRYDKGMQHLSTQTNGRPPVWRKAVLLVSLTFILLFDLLVNLAAALAGAEFFLVLAVPVFAVYLLFARIAFAGL